ncbi:hypothetical protein SCHPADRAFT_1002670 [Schizopora paradoxa]|uniref:CFEM domain-containing protein n=1 Tax=Schizopora paradoxa TaxID=27342 RepID=A0A0H2R8K7_9AGAM|nr:hypothetical protein SCHPADRAFT_1002670 [Schizopora paradoxa]
MLLAIFAVYGLLANVPLALADPSFADAIPKRSASLTAPIPSTTTTSGSSSTTTSTSSSSESVVISTSVTTLLTTSVGPNGTSTFSTTLTSVISSGGVATGTLTTTSFPSLGTSSPCVNNCLALAVSQVNCSTITDVSCFCVNGNFPLDLVGCVSAQCSDELSSAESLAREFCALASSSASLTFPASPTNSSTSSSSSSSSTQSPTPTGNSSTSLHRYGLLFGYEIFVSFVVVTFSFLAVIV